MQQSGLPNEGGVFHAPKAHPEIAKYLSLSLKNPPKELRSGKERRGLIGVLNNISSKWVTVLHDGCWGLLWNEDASSIVGGEIGAHHAMLKFTTLAPREKLSQGVYTSVCVLNPHGHRKRIPSPLPPGAYKLQLFFRSEDMLILPHSIPRLEVYHRITTPPSSNKEGTANGRWEGWVLSPFYPVTVV